MKQQYILNVSQIIILQNMIKGLDDAAQECWEIKDNAAYNRLVALKLNVREFLNYFEKRKYTLFREELK